MNGKGHALKITGIDSDGFIVSTWGKRSKVLFDDLKDIGDFIVTATEFVE